MSEFEGFQPDEDDPRAGDSSVEPLTEEEQESLAAGGPESLDANLEGKVVSLPALVTASSLLPPDDDPLTAIPSEPPDEDTPPDAAAPAFIVIPNAFGPGVPSVKLADGTPVGVWLDLEHFDLDGGEVAELLVLMGMEGGLAAKFGIRRDGRIEATAQLNADPNVKAFSEEEDRRLVAKEQVQQAFVQAHKKKEKKA